MNWKYLVEEKQLAHIKEESKEKLVLIFKNSTRCSISSLALNRLERDWKKERMEAIVPYYLDVIKDRNVSRKIESEFGVEHESPQVLLIKNGSCVYDRSHMAISYGEIEKLKDKISV